MATILLIDDDPENRDILKTRLEQAGYQVMEAQNGEEGLALSVSCKPDLIFLDVMMPKMDGWQVCRSLKANPATGQVPIVMLTACSKQVEELRGYESGANDYMMKPWDLEHLLGIVRKWVPGASGPSVPPPVSETPKPETPKPETLKPEAPRPDPPKPPGGIWA
jgi:DNA-binding response OmpR family regulator